MAKIRLARYEAEEGDLPSLCMRCGAPATTVRPKSFRWYPSWVLLWLLLWPCFIMVAPFLTECMQVRVPLCSQHRNYWRWRVWLIGIRGFLLLLAAIGASILVTAFQKQLGRVGEMLADTVYSGVLFLGLLWVILMAIVQQMAIRTTQITDHSITLINVSPDFAKALHEHREATDDEGREEEP